MTRKFLLLACLSGMVAVVLGGFGAHGLKKLLTEYQIQIFETGIRYQFYHTLALLAAANMSRYLSHRWTSAAAWLFITGMLFFSGSLYLLAVESLLELSVIRPVLGPMTPLGGLLLAGGWLCLFRASFDYKPSRSRSSRKEE